MGLAGYVLAGGGSTRFGRDKALVELGGKPMLLRMAELLRTVDPTGAIVGPPERYAEFGLPMVADRWPGAGPLGGIATALFQTAETMPVREWNLILGCDLPLLTREWLKYLTDRARASRAQAIVPRTRGGYEPLCACYRTTAAPALAAAIGRGQLKITDALSALEVEVLDEPHWKRFDSAGRLFWNMNTPAEYEAIRQAFGETQG